METHGNYLKDLTVIQKDLGNMILVDDNRTYIKGSQYPYIGLDTYDAGRFNEYLEGGYFTESFTTDACNNAAYVLGMLSQCKTMMEKNKLSLRDALSWLLFKGEIKLEISLEKAIENYRCSLNPFKEEIDRKYGIEEYLKKLVLKNFG